MFFKPQPGLGPRCPICADMLLSIACQEHKNLATILPKKVLILTLFCLGTVAHHLKINQIYNILYLLIHQEPVSAFEEENTTK